MPSRGCRRVVAPTHSSKVGNTNRSKQKSSRKGWLSLPILSEKSSLCCYAINLIQTKESTRRRKKKLLLHLSVHFHRLCIGPVALSIQIKMVYKSLIHEMIYIKFIYKFDPLKK
ncbi:hypothetical protein I3760_01G023300 [Carya illinoinensis]|nr:hypothetical protein I3760_01G023300 [Carya illinoinensis]